uniref:Uncharacterized protein n=1 Tax=Musa acuminata subsp. malaccensis TaxID=214687 RepID=A0A804HYA5_MUSAM
MEACAQNHQTSCQ